MMTALHWNNTRLLLKLNECKPFWLSLFIRRHANIFDSSVLQAELQYAMDGVDRRRIQ